MSTPIATLARFASSSTPGKYYEVRIGEDGVTYCTCFPWVKSRNQMLKQGKTADDATCQHKQAYLAGDKGDL